MRWEGSWNSRGYRRRLAAAALVTAGTVLLGACSGSSTADVTVTLKTTIPASGNSGGSAGSQSASSAPTKSAGSTSGKASSTGSAGSGSSSPGGSTSGGSSTPSSTAGGGAAQPDGFVPTKLKPGEKPPQFVIVSFDGVGWHEKWQYWKSIQDKVPFHFTGFLSGTYMLSSQTKDKYQGPGHGAGKASISWNEPADLPVEIADLNDAISRGDEIGTHFNGHFCSDNPPGGNDWNTADWNNELDQFFSLVKNVDANNGITDKLNLQASEVKGGRTPCLEGHAEDLFPALRAHGMTYDSSFTRHGISWPTKSKENKIWQIGMAEFPIHGTDHFQITMDYNFYYTQRNASSTGVTPEQSAADSAQVKATYEDMFKATYNGNRAPLILGNHFNEWNNNAYSDAIGNFVLETCGKPNVKCVPFRDLIAWMEMQDPKRLAQLQNQDPEVSA